LIAVGPGIAAGKKLGQFSMTRVAPTLAKLLRLSREALASRHPPVELGG